MIPVQIPNKKSTVTGDPSRPSNRPGPPGVVGGLPKPTDRPMVSPIGGVNKPVPDPGPKKIPSDPGPDLGPTDRPNPVSRPPITTNPVPPRPMVSPTPTPRPMVSPAPLNPVNPVVQAKPTPQSAGFMNSYAKVNPGYSGQKIPPYSPNSNPNHR